MVRLARQLALLLTLGLFVHSLNADEDPCGYAKVRKQYEGLNPIEEARKDIRESIFQFYVVGYQFAPTAPSISAGAEYSCMSSNYKIVVISAGFDMIHKPCIDERDALIDVALEFAQKYNEAVKSHLTSEGKYQCLDL